MAWPDDYITNTCRRLPTDYNVYSITDGADFLTKLATAQATDMVTAQKGEVLLLEGGKTYNIAPISESIALAASNSAHENSDYFICVISDDPANPAILNISQENLAEGAFAGWLLGFVVAGYSHFGDVLINFTSTQTLAAEKWAIPVVSFSQTNSIAGVRYNDVMITNAQVGSIVGLMWAWENSTFINNAVLATASYSVGSAALVGMVLAGSQTEIFNNTIRHPSLTYEYYNVSGVTVSVNNVAENGIAGNFEAAPGASFAQITDCNGCGDMSFAEDGVALTASDGNGTSLHDNVTFPFQDDINGFDRGTSGWDRGADYFMTTLHLSSTVMVRRSLRVGPDVSKRVAADLSNKING